MRWFVLAMLFILYVLNFADKSVLGLAADPIISDLSLSFDQFGLAGSSFYWFYAVGSILIASLSIKFGTKKLIVFIAAGWTISLLSAYFVTSLSALVAIRIALGFFEGGTLALCMAHIAKWFKPGARGTANAILLSGATFGAYLTAPILVKMIAGIGWQHTFAALGVSSLAWLVFFVFFKEEPKEKVDNYDMSQIQHAKMTFPEMLKMMVTPYFLSILLSFFTVMWLIAWVVVWGPTYLTKIVGLTPDQMGLAFASIGISAAIISIVVGRFADKLFAQTKNMFRSYILVAVSAMVIAAIAFASTTFVTSPILAILFLGIGITMNNCIAPFTSSVVSSMVEPSQVGSILGFKTGFGSLAGIIAPLLTGFLVSFAGDDLRTGFTYGVFVSVGLYVVSAALLFITAKKAQSNKEQGDASRQSAIVTESAVDPV